MNAIHLSKARLLACFLLVFAAACGGGSDDDDGPAPDADAAQDVSDAGDAGDGGDDAGDVDDTSDADDATDADDAGDATDTSDTSDAGSNPNEILGVAPFTVRASASSTVAVVGQSITVSVEDGWAPADGALTYDWELDGATSGSDPGATSQELSFDAEGLFLIGVTRNGCERRELRDRRRDSGLPHRHDLRSRRRR